MKGLVDRTDAGQVIYVTLVDEAQDVLADMLILISREQIASM